MDKSVSRRHLQFKAIPGAENHVAIDFGSSNGTFINESRIEQPTELKDGDVIRIGETVLGAPSSMMCVAREPLSRIEVEYRRRIDSMTISERVQRADALLSWARGFVARQILAERGPLSDERLKWEVALRQYGGDPTTRALIEGMRIRAPG